MAYQNHAYIDLSALGMKRATTSDDLIDDDQCAWADCASPSSIRSNKPNCYAGHNRCAATGAGADRSGAGYHWSLSHQRGACGHRRRIAKLEQRQRWPQRLSSSSPKITSWLVLLHGNHVAPVPSSGMTSGSTTSRGDKTSPQRHHRGSRGRKSKTMTNQVHFYGDASLPVHAMPDTSSTRPERNGVPVYMSRHSARSFRANMNATTTIFYRGCPVRPEHRVCRERVRERRPSPSMRVFRGTNRRGKPWRTAESPTANYGARVLGLRVTCAAIRGRFFGQGRLSTNDAGLPIMRLPKALWTRITKPFGMATHGGDRNPHPRITSPSVVEQTMPRRPSTKNLSGALGIACRNDYRSDSKSATTIRPRTRQDRVVCPRSSSE